MKLDLAKHIRNVPDFPKKGIGFKDITTLLQHKAAFKASVDQLARALQGVKIDAIAVVESRGFTFGSALAYKLGAGTVLIRKPGKLPFKTVAAEYALEYGTATIEIHADACAAGDRVLIVDDLIATGGTLLAAAQLFRSLQAEVAGVAAVIDLPELGGSARLRAADLTVHTLCEFSENE